MNSPHLIYRKNTTRSIVDTVQEAMEIDRLKNNSDPFKTTQRDVVDKLIELGSQHRIISNLLRQCGLKIPEPIKQPNAN